MVFHVLVCSSSCVLTARIWRDVSRITWSCRYTCPITLDRSAMQAQHIPNLNKFYTSWPVLSIQSINWWDPLHFFSVRIIFSHAIEIKCSCPSRYMIAVVCHYKHSAGMCFPTKSVNSNNNFRSTTRSSARHRADMSFSQGSLLCSA